MCIMPIIMCIKCTLSQSQLLTTCSQESWRQIPPHAIKRQAGVSTAHRYNVGLRVTDMCDAIYIKRCPPMMPNWLKFKLFVLYPSCSMTMDLTALNYKKKHWLWHGKKLVATVRYSVTNFVPLLSKGCDWIGVTVTQKMDEAAACHNRLWYLSSSKIRFRKGFKSYFFRSICWSSPSTSFLTFIPSSQEKRKIPLFRWAPKGCSDYPSETCKYVQLLNRQAAYSQGEVLDSTTRKSVKPDFQRKRLHHSSRLHIA